MNARKKIIAGLAFVAVLGGVIWWVLASRIPDPIYEGKPLSYWLEHPGTSSAMRDAAVRHAGTNAIPFLLRMLRAHDSTIKRRLMILVASQHLILYRFVSADELHARAIEGFIVLGPQGAGAVPELMRIYQTKALGPTSWMVLQILGKIGPEAKEAIPVLLAAATNSDQNVRSCAIYALGEMHTQPEIIVPVLAKALNDSNSLVQLFAAEGLGKFGPQARSALPQLLRIPHTPINDDWSGLPTVSRAVAVAVSKIDPAAPKAGIQITNASAEIK